MAISGGANNPVLSAAEAERSIDWLATARGRVGYLAMQNLLAYGTAGAAFGGVSAQTAVNQQWYGTAFGPSFGTLPAVGRYSGTRFGWTAGAGLEWMLASDLSLKAEYLYYDLGSASFASSALPTSFGGISSAIVVNSKVRFNGQLVRAGLNYHFDMPGVVAPVMARY